MVERQFVSAPLMPHYPLTVLCFSLQKSLAPSLSKCAPVPVQEARPSGPLEVVRGQVPVRTCTASRAAVLHACYLGDSAFNNLFEIPWPALPYLTHRSYSLLYMAASSRGPRIPTPSLALPSSSSLVPSSPWPRSHSSNMDGQPPGYHCWAPTALSSIN